MEKVKVTQKQAEWLDRYVLTQAQIDHYIDAHSYQKRPDSPIGDWESSKVARALYRGYEVEPEFKIGQWIVNKTKISTRKDIGKVTKVTSKALHADNGMGGALECFRHATDDEIAEEKTRRWWASHGRDVWGLKQGDVLWDLEFNECITVNNERVMPKRMRSLYKVVCFADDRKDL